MNLSKLPALCFASERKVVSGRGLSKFMDRSNTASDRFTVPVKSTEHVFADVGCFRKRRFVQTLQHVIQELAERFSSPTLALSQAEIWSHCQVCFCCS